MKKDEEDDIPEEINLINDKFNLTEPPIKRISLMSQTFCAFHNLRMTKDFSRIISNDSVCSSRNIETKKVISLTSAGYKTQRIPSKNLITVNLRGQRLNTFPMEVLSTPRLQVLQLDNNNIPSVPYEISRLTCLEFLGLGHNNIVKMPVGFRSLKKMKVLRMHYNKLKEFPDWFCLDLENLQILYLHGNLDIQVFPHTFFHLAQLREFSFDWVQYISEEGGWVLEDDHGISCIQSIQNMTRIANRELFRSTIKSPITFWQFFQYFKTHWLSSKTVAELPLLLHTSCQAGHSVILTELLKHKELDINLQDSEGNTPLLHAIKNHKLECVKILLQSKGIEIDKAENCKEHPITRFPQKE